MKKKIKIVTIGGGSSYTPELMEGFIKRYEEVPIREIWLVDVEQGKEKLEIVGAMAQRMWDATPYDVKVHLTLNRREALPDADFVTTQLRVGQIDARIKDERIPLSYGILGQETNGPGGIFKAFRTIPVILDVIRDMRELCPDAWLINFANPSGMIAEAAINQGGWEKCVGLCNIPIGSMLKEPLLFGKTADEMTYRFAGLNHFHWHRVYDTDGSNITGEILRKLVEEGADIGIPANIPNARFLDDQIRALDVIPCAYHRYYFNSEFMLNHCLNTYHGEGTRGQIVKKTERELFELYKDPELNYKPKQLEQRGGAHYSDAACECINGIYNNKKEHMVVSTRNRGAVPDLSPDDVAEVSCEITSAGPQPLAFGKLGPAERGWLQLMKAMEQCVVRAAVSGDYGMALQAFILNPLIPSGKTAQRVLDEMLVAHEAFLPQFKDKIAELKENGVEPKDPIVRKMMGYQ